MESTFYYFKNICNIVYIKHWKRMFILDWDVWHIYIYTINLPVGYRFEDMEKRDRLNNVLILGLDQSPRLLLQIHTQLFWLRPFKVLAGWPHVTRICTLQIKLSIHLQRLQVRIILTYARKILIKRILNNMPYWQRAIWRASKFISTRHSQVQLLDNVWRAHKVSG